MTICAIHQPNFFPWIGYFDKIQKADVFIFLDEVAYPKSGSGTGSWCNRVKLLNNGQADWFGLSIKRQSGMQPINEVEFANKEYQVSKLLRRLELNYKKAMNYQKIAPMIEALLQYPTNNLAEFNIHAIKTIAGYLGLQTTFVRQSELVHSKRSTELLVELLHQVGATTYLCGMGSGGYQEDNLFEEVGINLCYQSLNLHELFLNASSHDTALSILHLLLTYEYEGHLTGSEKIVQGMVY